MVAINIDSKIKTYSEIPKKWGKTHCYNTLTADVHYEDGFRDVREPSFDPAVEKVNRNKEAIYFNAENDVFTYPVIAKTPEELEQEKIQKQQQQQEKIKQAKLEKIVEDNLSLAECLLYYPEWKSRHYAVDEKAVYKGKTFINTVEGNTNAPDKGGWIEKK